MVWMLVMNVVFVERLMRRVGSAFRHKWLMVGLGYEDKALSTKDTNNFSIALDSSYLRVLLISARAKV